MTRVLISAIAALLAIAGATPAQDATKDWPSRTVRIIIPLAAGGGGDIFARLLAEELQKRLGSHSWSRTAPAAGSTSARELARKRSRMATRSASCRASRWSTTSSCSRAAVQSGEGLHTDRQPVLQSRGAGRQFQAQRQDNPGTGETRQRQARYAELRHVLVRAGAVDRETEEEGRHRYRPSSVPERQRGGQCGDGRYDAGCIARLEQHAVAGSQRSHHWRRAQRQHALTAVPRFADAEGGERRRLSGHILRTVRAGRLATADPRQGSCRSRRHHQ